MSQPNLPTDDATGPTDSEASALDQFQPGAVVRVVAIDAASSIEGRLLDLGFVPQTRVVVLRRAPLADPIAFEVRGSRICLRRSEAARVRVVVESQRGRA